MLKRELEPGGNNLLENTACEVKTVFTDSTTVLFWSPSAVGYTNTTLPRYAISSRGVSLKELYNILAAPFLH